MDDDAAPIVDFPAPNDSVARRKVRWAFVAAALIAAAALVSAGFLAGPGLRDGRVIAGVPTANPAEVIQAAEERRAQEAAEIEAEKKAQAAALLQELEAATTQSMQEFFDDPSNDMGIAIEVIAVHLIKTAETKYEGMATMKAGSHQARDIPIHVTADDRNSMWTIDPGALLPLLN
jgi:hypothetical protein